jgi:hypothetical protein
MYFKQIITSDNRPQRINISKMKVVIRPIEKKVFDIFYYVQ